MTHTSESVHEKFGVSILDQEYPEMEVPILSGNQRQGDVMVLAVTTNQTGGATRIEKAGVVVVRAESDARNTHTLYSLSGECLWRPNPRVDRDGELLQGWLTVRDGAEAVLLHTSEHSALGLAPPTEYGRPPTRLHPRGCWRFESFGGHDTTCTTAGARCDPSDIPSDRTAHPRVV